MTDKVVLFPGRFQPFHRGHLENVKNLLKDHKKVVIGIRQVPSNIFSLVQTYTIISQSIKNIDNIIVIILPNDLKQWPGVGAYFDIIATGNDELNESLSLLYKTVHLPRFGDYSASDIRERLKQDLSISNLMCLGTEELIKGYYELSD